MTEKKRKPPWWKFAGRVPGQALTKEQWEALGGNDPDKRPLTQDPIGAHPHPKTGSPE